MKRLTATTKETSPPGRLPAERDAHGVDACQICKENKVNKVNGVKR